MQRPRLTAPTGTVVLATVVVSIVVPHTGHAAQAQSRPVSASAQELMRRLDWMVGEWEGSGWVESAESGPKEFLYSLNVRSVDDGRLLIADGVGYPGINGLLPYAEHLLISGPPYAVLPGPPGTYTWQELSSSMHLRVNEAQGTERGLQVGYPFSRQECDRIVADVARRTNCRGGEMKWSRVNISLNDDGEWVQTREWQEVQGDDRSWHTYFKVVLRKAEKR